MDKGFIQRATKVTSFNLVAADFQTTKYKKEIQFLFGFYMFPNFDLEKTVDTVNKSTLNKLIDQLRSISSENLYKLHSYNLKGVGPGEATLFFLINKAHLGGGSSAGVDLVVGSNKYEVKAVTVSTDRVASNFKLGGTVKLSDIIEDLGKLCKELKLTGWTSTEINGGIIKQLKEKAPERFQAIEKKFASRAAEYFAGHEVIFINNSNANRIGTIEEIKLVKKEDIMLERVTSGTIKPKVKL